MVSVSFQSIVSSYLSKNYKYKTCCVKVSVSFQSIVSSYDFEWSENTQTYIRFPSPFRASFLLISSTIDNLYTLWRVTFPSPFRASFLLIF